MIFEHDDHDNYDNVQLIIMMKNVQNLNMKPIPGKGEGGERHQTCHHRSTLEHTHPPADWTLELEGSFIEGNAKQTSITIDRSVCYPMQC